MFFSWAKARYQACLCNLVVQAPLEGESWAKERAAPARNRARLASIVAFFCSTCGRETLAWGENFLCTNIEGWFR